MQINNILGTYAPRTSQGYARVSRALGLEPFVTYAVVNDGGKPGEKSDDGAFIASAP